MVTTSAGAVLSRHDYQPYGEELLAGTGGRSSAQGYGGADNLRQHFTGYERDAETGQEFAQARYYSGASGRFTSPDPLQASASAMRPQSWNRYAYTYNNPLKYSDPSGMLAAREPVDYSFRQTGAGVYGGLETASSFDSSSEAWVEMQQRAAAAEMVQEAVGAGLFGAIAAASVPGAAQQNTPPPPNECEQQLATIFGGRGAVFRTRYDYLGDYRGRDPKLAAEAGKYPRGEMGNPRFNAEHLYWFPHLAGNFAGTENTDVYVPSGFEPGSVTGPTKGDAVVTFYYKAWDVTLAVFHVRNFSLSREGNRVRIGTTGGPGGDSGGPRPNRHSHFELWNGRTGFLPPGMARDNARIPFVLAFCPGQ